MSRETKAKIIMAIIGLVVLALIFGSILLALEGGTK